MLKTGQNWGISKIANYPPNAQLRFAPLALSALISKMKKKNFAKISLTTLLFSTLNMEKIMIEENVWDHNVDAAMVEGPVEKVSLMGSERSDQENKTGKGCRAHGSNNGNDRCRRQNCRGSDVTALPTSFGWKEDPE